MTESLNLFIYLISFLIIIIATDRNDSISDLDRNGMRKPSSVGVIFKFHVRFSIDHQVTDLEVPVNNVLDIKVIIAVSEGIDEILSHFEPAEVEDKLQGGEEWEVEVVDVVVVSYQVDSAGNYNYHH